MDQSRLGPFVLRPRRVAALLFPIVAVVLMAGCQGHRRSSMRPVYLAPAPAASAGCSSSAVPVGEPALTPAPAAPTTGRTTAEPGLEPASVPAEAPLSSTPAGPSIPRIDTPPPVTAPVVPGGSSDEPGMELQPASPGNSKVDPARSGTRGTSATPGSTSPNKAPGASLRDDATGTTARRRTSPVPPTGRVRSASLREDLQPYVNDPADLFLPPKADRPWKYVVLHHSANVAGGYASIDAEHRKRLGWNGCGYHFVIGNGTETPDGRIEVSQRWVNQKLGVHCRDGKNPDVNEYGIGICLVGDLEKSPPTDRQVAAARALVAYLEDRYHIAHDHTETHAHLAASPTSCPGRHFPTQAILNGKSLAQRIED